MLALQTSGCSSSAIMDDEVKICTRCESYLSKRKHSVSEKQSGVECSVCLGLGFKSFSAKLTKALTEAIEPYGGAGVNGFSRQLDPPNLILPGDLVYRYHAVSRAKKNLYPSPKPLPAFAHELKQYSKNVLNQCLDQLSEPQDLDQYPSCVKDEEEGHLSVHVFVVPRKDLPRPDHMLPSQNNHRRSRKRKMDDSSQGGDPRRNLELRLSKAGLTLWSMNQAVDSNIVLDSDKDFEMLRHPVDGDALEVYVAIWRRPFYLRGMYSKNRRDVSQSPFYVVEQGRRQKLGVTSVEEQILPVVSRYSGGMSTVNNDPTTNKVRFGMAKFHASGREDMDVRMLLPDTSVSGHDDSQIAGGRPFVCEVIDALRLPLPTDLEKIVHEINHTTAQDSTTAPRSYGKNEMGVGIAPTLEFVPSASFKTLQSETENKVKYYGCLCWSEETLAVQEELTRRLGSFPLEIQQKTPIRVLHRRSNMVRVRNILSGRAQRIDDHYFRLHISTDAGTYVKEFVHGDLGRTVPSMSSLLCCKTDILELDCEGIQVS